MNQFVTPLYCQIILSKQHKIISAKHFRTIAARAKDLKMVKQILRQKDTWFTIQVLVK